jgi:hypothetical protein
MYMKAALIVMTAFLLGIVSTIAFNYYYYPQPQWPSTTTYYIGQDDDSSIISRVLGNGPADRLSPQDRIAEENIRVEKDRVIINVPNAVWARFTDTKSMDPVLDVGANAIQIIPKDPSEIFPGDIVSYQSRYADGIIIHRVIEIGYDEEGWYAIMKGDNNPRPDPGKIRFSQVRRVLVAIIY